MNSIKFIVYIFLISLSNFFAVVPLRIARDNDDYENSMGGKILDKNALEENLESASEIGGDEESEDGITGIRSSADDNDDDDNDEENEEEEDESDDSEIDDESDSGPDLARGKGNIETSSEDEEDMADVLPEESGFEHAWRELDKDAPRGDEVIFWIRLFVKNIVQVAFMDGRTDVIKWEKLYW